MLLLLFVGLLTVGASVGGATGGGLLTVGASVGGATGGGLGATCESTIKVGGKIESEE